MCFLPLQAHARPRVPRASGVPHALFGRKIHQRLGRIASRGRERVFRRHCERSEAIHPFFTRQDGLLRFARNDGRGSGLLRGACHRARIRATRWLAMTASRHAYKSRGTIRPSFAGIFLNPLIRGRRECRAPMRRGKKCARSSHGHTGITRHSPRNGFTVSFVLSPAIGLFCHRHLRDLPQA